MTTKSLRLWGAPFAAAVLLAVTLSIFYSAQNDFPFQYHSDEPHKAQQVRSGNYNFHHPMLLLGTASSACRFLPEEKAENLQTITETGRTVAAIFMSLAITAVAASFYLLYGWIGFIFAAGFLVACPDLYVFSHFFKEDTALLFGCGVTLSALAIFQKSASDWAVWLIGAGCGLAISGKYIGVLMLFAALLSMMLVAAPDSQSVGKWKIRRRYLGIILAGTAITFVLVNSLALTNPSQWQAAFSREMSFVTAGRETPREALVNPRFYRELSEALPRAILIPAGLYLILFFTRRLFRQPLHLALLIFAGLYLLLLPFSAIYSQRYLLPAHFCIHSIAALGFLELIRFVLICLSGLHGKWKAVKWPVAGALTLGMAFALYDHGAQALPKAFMQFENGSRERLAEYIRRHVPVDAKVLQTSSVKFGAPDYGFLAEVEPSFPQELRTVQRLYQIRDLAELQAKGFSYVIFTNKGARDIRRARARLKHLQENEGLSQSDALVVLAREGLLIHAELLTEAELVYEDKPRLSPPVHPDLFLYKIPEIDN